MRHQSDPCRDLLSSQGHRAHLPLDSAAVSIMGRPCLIRHHQQQVVGFGNLTASAKRTTSRRSPGVAFESLKPPFGVIFGHVCLSLGENRVRNSDIRSRLDDGSRRRPAARAAPSRLPMVLLEMDGPTDNVAVFRLSADPSDCQSISYFFLSSVKDSWRAAISVKDCSRAARTLLGAIISGR